MHGRRGGGKSWCKAHVDALSAYLRLDLLPPQRGVSIHLYVASSAVNHQRLQGRRGRHASCRSEAGRTAARPHDRPRHASRTPPGFPARLPWRAWPARRGTQARSAASRRPGWTKTVENSVEEQQRWLAHGVRVSQGASSSHARNKQPCRMATASTRPTCARVSSRVVPPVTANTAVNSCSRGVPARSVAGQGHSQHAVHGKLPTLGTRASGPLPTHALALSHSPLRPTLCTPTHPLAHPPGAPRRR